MGDFNHITLAVKIWEWLWVLNSSSQTLSVVHRARYPLPFWHPLPTHASESDIFRADLYPRRGGGRRWRWRLPGLRDFRSGEKRCSRQSSYSPSSKSSYPGDSWSSHVYCTSARQREQVSRAPTVKSHWCKTAVHDSVPVGSARRESRSGADTHHIPESVAQGRPGRNCAGLYRARACGGIRARRSPLRLRLDCMMPAESSRQPNASLRLVCTCATAGCTCCGSPVSFTCALERAEAAPASACTGWPAHSTAEKAVKWASCPLPVRR